MDPREALCEVGQRMEARGWVPATSGNLSARDGDGFWISGSGHAKGALRPEHFVCVGPRGAASGRPSAETALHAGLYGRLPGCHAVLHVHSVHATAVSLGSPDGVDVDGHEIVKAFAGVTTHEGRHRIPVFANDQDVGRLWEAVAAAPVPSLPGFLVAGHGLYAWGGSIGEAWRHLEAFEHVFAVLVAVSVLRAGADPSRLRAR